MDGAAASTWRAELVAALAANTARLCDGPRAELARPVKPELGRCLQFEADPSSWGVSSCASEEGRRRPKVEAGARATAVDLRARQGDPR